MPSPPEVVESICMTTSGDLNESIAELNETIAMPDNAIIIKSQTGSYVDFSLSQQWSDEVGLAIKSGLDTCIIKGNVTFGGSEDIRGECIEGFAAVTVVVYMDDAFEPDECEACDADDLTDVGGGYEFCAYRVEIPCEPMIVECGEPSSAPTGEPTQSPTSGPTTSPSVVPTGSSDSPTNLPSQFPTSLEQPEDGCPENPAVLIGSDGETMYPTMPIEIKTECYTRSFQSYQYLWKHYLECLYGIQHGKFRGNRVSGGGKCRKGFRGRHRIRWSVHGQCKNFHC